MLAPDSVSDRELLLKLCDLVLSLTRRVAPDDDVFVLASGQAPKISDCGLAVGANHVLWVPTASG